MADVNRDHAVLVGTEESAPPSLGGGGLRGEQLVKSYGRRTVVDGVSLDVKPGEVVGLLGPNGAGKTTTFYMLVGVVRANAGRVFIGDQDVTRLPMHRRARLGIGYLPQHASIFQKLTVWENVMAIAELMPISREERVERVQRVLARFGVDGLSSSRGYQLSGGERRRVEIARCLASEPKFMLLDEPFTGVDPKAVRDIQSIVQGLRDDGIGVLITDHSVRETLDIADRAYIIEGGSILTEGKPEELKRDELAARAYFGDVFAHLLQAKHEEPPEAP
ncbi:MAG TPA: LPS export ABC transporter ATP-binding protein [Armatimonadota bacterium]|nr:LPS export ABC transporter ATP-binding protein [Armatimonadota bacterium]HQK95972.1 LPS export ABC transporter ATP-binding protein [Armatimonadota bacterium]